MKSAIKLPQYSDMKSFTPPDGVQLVRVDRTSWLPADDSCPEDYTLAFLNGTVPGSTCSRMGSSPQTLIQGLFGAGAANPSATPATPANPQSPAAAEPNPPKKKNFLEKIFGGGDKDKPVQPAPPPPPPQ